MQRSFARIYLTKYIFGMVNHLFLHQTALKIDELRAYQNQHYLIHCFMWLVAAICRISKLRMFLTLKLRIEAEYVHYFVAAVPEIKK